MRNPSPDPLSAASACFAAVAGPIFRSLDSRIVSRSNGAPHSPQHFGGDPARTQGSISFGGKVAKWAPGKGWVETVQTERLLRPAHWVANRRQLGALRQRSWIARLSARRPDRTAASSFVRAACRVAPPESRRRRRSTAALGQQEQVLVRLGRAVGDRLGHRVGLCPDDVGAQVPAIGSEGEGDHPGDADEVFGLEAGRDVRATLRAALLVLDVYDDPPGLHCARAPRLTAARR